METITFDKFREIINTLVKSPELAEQKLTNTNKYITNGYTQMIQGACIYLMTKNTSKNTSNITYTINELLDQLKTVETLNDFSTWIQNIKHLTDQQLTTLRYKLYVIEEINEEIINWTMGFTWIINATRENK